MTLNQPPWPRQWLMTDQRIGERLWPLLEQLPVGSGIVLRHDRLPAAERARMADRVAAIARERELVLGVAGDVDLAHRVGAALIHRPTPHRPRSG